MLRLSTLLTAAFLAVSVAAEDIFYCGTKPYYPSAYTCFDGDFLCPKINGLAYLRCDDACYNHNQYTCV